MSGSVRLDGVALHAGIDVAVTLHRHEGPILWRFGAHEHPHHAMRILRADRGVQLGTDDGAHTVDLVEHLFAALGGLNVSRGLVIEVEGPELPLLDGAASTFARALRQLGLGGDPPSWEVARPGSFELEGSTYRFEPTQRAATAIEVEVDFPPPVGHEHAAWTDGPEAFERDIAPARTFGWMSEADALRAVGRARGVNPRSVLVFTGDGVLPGSDPPAPAECARHKLLDLVGDLAIWGGPPRGLIHATRPGHARTHVATRMAIEEGILRAAVPPEIGTGGHELAR